LISSRLKNLEQGILNNNIDWKNLTPIDIARFSKLDNVLTRNFPKSEKETDLQYAKRIAGVLRKTTTVKELIPVSRQNAGELVELGMMSGTLYQDNGNAWESLDKWRDETAGLWGSESNLMESLMNSVAAEKEGKPVNNQLPGVTTLIMSGPHTGRMKHTFASGMNTGPSKQHIIFSPVAGTERTGVILKEISTAQTSVNPEYNKEINMGEHGVLKIFNRPSKDGTSVETVIDDNGTELSYERVQQLQEQLILSIWKNSGNQMERAFNFKKRKNERP
jgi:hypothetical protein